MATRYHARETRSTDRLSPRLHDAYEWIASAGEWEDALSSPEQYASDAAANAAEHGHSDITESDLLDVIEWFSGQRKRNSHAREHAVHAPPLGFRPGDRAWELTTKGKRALDQHTHTVSAQTQTVQAPRGPRYSAHQSEDNAQDFKNSNRFSRKSIRRRRARRVARSCCATQTRITAATGNEHPCIPRSPGRDDRYHRERRDRWWTLRCGHRRRWAASDDRDQKPRAIPGFYSFKNSRDPAERSPQSEKTMSLTSDKKKWDDLHAALAKASEAANAYDRQLHSHYGRYQTQFQPPE